MPEIITDTTDKAFNEAKESLPHIAKSQVDIDKIIRTGEVDNNVRLKAELLVKKQIESELVTIREEQLQMTKRRAEDLIASGINTKSDLWPRACIHPRAYFRWLMAYPGCWEDKEFMDEYLRDNPEADLRKYIKSVSTLLDKHSTIV